MLARNGCKLLGKLVVRGDMLHHRLKVAQSAVLRMTSSATTMNRRFQVLKMISQRRSPLLVAVLPPTPTSESLTLNLKGPFRSIIPVSSYLKSKRIDPNMFSSTTLP